MTCDSSPRPSTGWSSCAAGAVLLDGPPAVVFAAPAWETLASTYLEPPLAAVIGERLGLGSTPTDDRLVAALAGSPRGG